MKKPDNEDKTEKNKHEDEVRAKIEEQIKIQKQNEEQYKQRMWWLYKNSKNKHYADPIL